ARIGFELEAREPGFSGQVRDRRALANAALDEREDVGSFRGRQARHAVVRRKIVRQVERVQDEMRGLVERIVVAVAERETGAGEAARTVADEIDDRGEFVGHAWLGSGHFGKYRGSGRL